MKDSVIRFRCSEAEKAAIEKMAEASPYVKGVSDYILDLIREDAKNYHSVEIEAVVRGINKDKTETIDKKREPLGEILVDEYGRGSVKQYDRLMKEASEAMGALAKKPNHYLELRAGGKKVEIPSPMADFVQFEERA